MEITLQQFTNALLSATTNVINARTVLNEMNVFPVADSDTGNNLVFLMKSLQNSLMKDHGDVKELLSDLALSAFKGARGNSGMIFANYINGIEKNYHTRTNVLDDLRSAFYYGVNQAYDAVLDPQEGTILSVMKDYSNAIFNKTITLDEALSIANESLIKTKEIHPVLRKNQVIDAGAKGFYLFISGMTQSLLEATVIETQVEEQLYHDDLSENLTSKPEFKYCFEVTINKSYSLSEINGYIKTLGDSIVVASSGDSTKIHIHTDYPSLVINKVQELGEVTNLKVENMNEQYYGSSNKNDIAIVTDSIADLPQSVIDSNTNVYVLTLSILVNDLEHYDKVTITNEEVIGLANNPAYSVSSSMVNEYQVSELITRLEENYKSVLFISVASKLSGTYQLINNTLRKYKGSLNAYVVDSLQNSVAQGLLVEYAIDLINEDKDFNEIVEEIEKAKRRTSIYVLVSDLNPMIKSGRVPSKLGNFLKKIKLLPIITLSETGEGKLINFAFSKRQVQNKILKKALSKSVAIEKLAIGYTTTPDNSRVWEKYLIDKNLKVDYVVKTSSIIALSAGDNASCIAFMLKEE